MMRFPRSFTILPRRGCSSFTLSVRTWGLQTRRRLWRPSVLSCCQNRSRRNAFCMQRRPSIRSIPGGSLTFYRANRENGYIHAAGSGHNRQRRQTKLKYPSAYVTVGEVCPEGSGAFYFSWLNEASNVVTLGLSNHNGQSVYLRGDGHADTIEDPGNTPWQERLRQRILSERRKFREGVGMRKNHKIH